MSKKGVYKTQKADNTVYYRSSFTYKNKHISLGSFDNEKDAYNCYRDAVRISSSSLSINDYNEHRFTIPFEKYVSIVNFRDNNVYFSNPIYLQKRFFLYYFDKKTIYKFDIDDLFYYAGHKISKRGNHLFVADYGMQVNILSRYNIRSHAVVGRDYIFINGDSTDFRYENIEIINQYTGVLRVTKKNEIKYKAYIHINNNFVIGYYDADYIAAIAYNKAADELGTTGRKYQQNYIDFLSAREYAEIYSQIKIPNKILDIKKANR